MKKIFCLPFFLLTIASFSQTDIQLYSRVDSFYSKTLKENRKVFIYDPGHNGNENIDGKRIYPVIYLFDAEQNFEPLVSMTRELSKVGQMPEAIVVGILNTDRSRDLTPTHLTGFSDLEKTLHMDDGRHRTSGGGENFISFIENELIPHIDSTCATAPYRLLIGHSLGGLATINILLNHSHLFNSYIAIDPTVYWNNLAFMKKSEKDLSTKKFDGKSLFYALANSRSPEAEKIPLENDASPRATCMKYCFQFKDTLLKNEQNHLRVDWKYYKDEHHASVPLIAEYNGLRFIFDFYWLYVPNQNIPNENDLWKFNVDSAYTTHYREISNRMRYTVLPPVYPVSFLAYYFLSKKMFEKAYRLFQLNLENYPENYMVYEGMGDYYNGKGESKRQ